MTDRLTDVALTHDHVTVDGTRLHTVTAGDPAGPLVVCLHGFPEFWYSWRAQIPGLVAAGYRVVAPDLRGYNRSEKPPGVGSYTLDELVGDVTGLIRHYGDSAHLVGHDWGGTLAWTTAAEHPDLLDSLTVMNAPHPAALAERFDLAQLRRSWYALAFQLPWLPERLLTLGRGRAVGSMFRESAATPAAFTDEDIHRYREAFCRPGAARAAVNYYRAYARETAGAMAGAVLPGTAAAPPADTEMQVPTLLLWGEQDPALGVGLSEGLERWVADLRVERFPAASHWVQHDAPERVSDRLLEFLDGRGADEDAGPNL